MILKIILRLLRSIYNCFFALNIFTIVDDYMQTFIDATHSNFMPIVYLENACALFSMITEGEAAILLETTLRAFRNQSQSAILFSKPGK